MRRLLLVGGLGVLLAWTAWTAVTQVQMGERAVVRRFGRILDERPKPGLYIGLPWGIDRVDRIQVSEIRRVVVGFPGAAAEREFVDSTPPGQLLTGDHNLINLQAEVQYSVVENEVEKFLLQRDRANGIIERTAEAALAEWVAGRPVDEVLLRGKATLPVWLETALQKKLAPYDLGVHIESVSVADLLPPSDVKKEFDAVASAQTEIRTATNRAEQTANRLRRETEGEIYRIRRQTDAYTNEQVLMALAEAQAFEKHMKQYHELREQNPYYLAGLWWNDMGRIYQQMRENGRIDVLDNYLGSNGLNITQMPLLPKK